MNRTESKELIELIIASMIADPSAYYGQGKFYITQFMNKLYDEGFEITVRKKKVRK